ncbi:MAG: serine hydrolase [Bacteroidetes bacterium]|nr:serine hydrolase [Bacteroidota bacterium]
MASSQTKRIALPNPLLKQAWVDSVFYTLTIQQKIGQLFMMPIYPSENGIESYQQAMDLVANYGLGGVIAMKGDPYYTAKWLNDFNERARLPLFAGIDGEWGISMRMSKALIYPKQMTLGAIQNNNLITELGRQIGQECRAIGINVNFAPVVDINTNPNNPVINHRSFGEEKSNVALKGLNYALGLQDQLVLPCAKHFPGHGDTDKDSHKDLPVINKSKTQLMHQEMYPFRFLFNNGIKSTMVAHIYMPQQDKTKNLAASLSKKIVTDILQNEVGFKGLIFTDALNMEGVSKFFRPGEIEVKALKAGNDVLLFSSDMKFAQKKIMEAIDLGTLNRDDIEAKSEKVLSYKYDLNLANYLPTDTSRIKEVLNSEQGQILRKKLFEEAMTLVSNKDNLIPFKKLNFTLATVSIGAEEITKFQKTIERYTPCKHFVLKKSDTLQYDQLIKDLTYYDKIIVSIHSMSHLPALNYGLSPATLNFIKALRKKKKDVILCVPGSPYALKYFSDIDWLLCGYEDNSTTHVAMAEALFGLVPIMGKLPVSSGSFKVANGIMTKELFRLKYKTESNEILNAEARFALDSMCLEMIQRKATPSCQMMIVKDGQIIYDKAFGTKTYDYVDTVNTSSMYDIASLTKVCATTLATMKLVGERKLDIQKQVKDYLLLEDSAKINNLVLSQILLHQAGLYPFIPFYAKYNKAFDTYFRNQYDSSFSVHVAKNLYLRNDIPDSMWAEMIYHRVDSTPRYKYSDLTMYIMQAIIESNTNISLDNYSMKYFYEPMGLRCRFNPLNYYFENKMVPTEDDKEFRRQLLLGNVHDPGAAMYGGVAGHAGLFSNAHDIAVLFQMLLNNGSYAGVKYLDSAVIRQFTSYQSNISRRGYGFDKPAKVANEDSPCAEEASFRTFGHTGFTGTCAWADPDNNLIFVLLTNRIHPSVENKRLIQESWRVKIMSKVYQLLQK